MSHVRPSQGPTMFTSRESGTAERETGRALASRAERCRRLLVSFCACHGKTAEGTAVEHKDQVHQAVQNAEAGADEKAGGQYRDQIQKAAAKARCVRGRSRTWRVARDGKDRFRPHAAEHRLALRQPLRLASECGRR